MMDSAVVTGAPSHCVLINSAVKEIEAIRLEPPRGFRVNLDLLCIYRSLVYPCRIRGHWRNISPPLLPVKGKVSATAGSEKINRHCGAPGLKTG